MNYKKKRGASSPNAISSTDFRQNRAAYLNITRVAPCQIELHVVDIHFVPPEAEFTRNGRRIGGINWRGALLYFSHLPGSWRARQAKAQGWRDEIR